MFNVIKKQYLKHTTCLLIVIGLLLGGCSITRSLVSTRAVAVETISLAPSSEPQKIITTNSLDENHTSNPDVIIEIDDAKPGQLMDGIGGAFNEQGWDALLSLSPSERQLVLENLFNVKNGANLCFNRIPIGASDFALSAYSLDDTKDDWPLKNFSIKRDESCMIPYIKAAQQINPRMKFHASPWSPPGWMKTNGSQTGGGELLGDNRTLQTHAHYLVKFLKAYEGHHIFIDRLCPQNEPLVSGSYPGCKIPAPLYCRAVTEFIIPAVKKAGLKTRVWAGTFNYWKADTRKHFEAIFASEQMNRAIGGISFQYSNIDWVKQYHEKYPAVSMQHSESECYNGANAKVEVLRDFQDYIAYTRAGCGLFTFWNMVLPEPHTSTWGWSQNSLVTIDKKKKSVQYEPSYALARFLGHHVIAGSHYLPARITKGDSLIGDLNFAPKDCVKFMHTELAKGEQVAAFIKPNGNIVVFLLNQGGVVTAKLKTGHKSVEVTLPAESLVAAVF